MVMWSAVHADVVRGCVSRRAGLFRPRARESRCRPVRPAAVSEQSKHRNNRRSAMTSLRPRCTRRRWMSAADRAHTCHTECRGRRLITRTDRHLYLRLQPSDVRRCRVRLGETDSAGRMTTGSSVTNPECVFHHSRSASAQSGEHRTRRLRLPADDRNLRVATRAAEVDDSAL